MNEDYQLFYIMLAFKKIRQKLFISYLKFLIKPNNFRLLVSKISTLIQLELLSCCKYYLF